MCAYFRRGSEFCQFTFGVGAVKVVRNFYTKKKTNDVGVALSRNVIVEVGTFFGFKVRGMVTL